MTSFAATPTYPVPGRVTKLTFTLTETGANYIRAWLIDAPKESDWKRKLTDARQGRIEIHAGPGGATDEAAFEPDKPGGYRITMREYDKGAADYGGGYQDSTDGHQTEAALGSSEVPATLYVGQRMTQGVGYSGSTGQLLVYVFDDTIRETSEGVQGEASPEIINTSNGAARTAALDSNVQTQLAALDDAAVSTVAGTISAYLDNIITRFNLHSISTTFHASGDNDNVIDGSFFNPSGPAGIVASLNELRLKLDLHMRNAKSDATETGSQAYHAPVAGKRADLENMILAPPADSSDMSTAYVLLGDIYRAYEAHRVSETPTGVHDADDPTALGAMAALPNLHRYYCDSLRQPNPTLPAGSTEQTGAVELTQTAGFKDAS